MSSSVGWASEGVGPVGGTETGAGADEGGGEGGDSDAVETSGTSVGSNGCSSAACRRVRLFRKKGYFDLSTPEGAGARRWTGEGSTLPSSTKRLVWRCKAHHYGFMSHGYSHVIMIV